MVTQKDFFLLLGLSFRPVFFSMAFFGSNLSFGVSTRGPEGSPTSKAPHVQGLNVMPLRASFGLLLAGEVSSVGCSGG